MFNLTTTLYTETSKRVQERIEFTGIGRALRWHKNPYDGLGWRVIYSSIARWNEGWLTTEVAGV